jgi:hypothetical protein
VGVLEPTWRGVVRHLSREFCEVRHAATHLGAWEP